MSATTGIEWTEHTWNPMVGCSVVSEGCRNCYAVRQARRLETAFGMPQYEGTTCALAGKSAWTGQVNRATDRAMHLPDRTKKPAVFFVNSMSDFWHPAAPPAARLEAWHIMERHPEHTFQVLTKRPENIAPMLADMGVSTPSNVWLGATVENQRAADERIPLLCAIPCDVHFLSCEPLLGPVDLEADSSWLLGIQWVITGGETGPGARRMLPDWVEKIDATCASAGVPHFFKQWGDIDEHGERVGKHVAGHLLRGENRRAFPAGVTLRR